MSAALALVTGYDTENSDSEASKTPKRSRPLLQTLVQDYPLSPSSPSVSSKPSFPIIKPSDPISAPNADDSPSFDITKVLDAAAAAASALHIDASPSVLHASLMQSDDSSVLIPQKGSVIHPSLRSLSHAHDSHILENDSEQPEKDALDSAIERLASMLQESQTRKQQMKVQSQPQPPPAPQPASHPPDEPKPNSSFDSIRKLVDQTFASRSSHHPSPSTIIPILPISPPQPPQTVPRAPAPSSSRFPLSLSPQRSHPSSSSIVSSLGSSGFAASVLRPPQGAFSSTMMTYQQPPPPPQPQPHPQSQSQPPSYSLSSAPRSSFSPSRFASSPSVSSSLPSSSSSSVFLTRSKPSPQPVSIYSSAYSSFSSASASPSRSRPITASPPSAPSPSLSSSSPLRRVMSAYSSPPPQRPSSQSTRPSSSSSSSALPISSALIASSKLIQEYQKERLASASPSSRSMASPKPATAEDAWQRLSAKNTVKEEKLQKLKEELLRKEMSEVKNSPSICMKSREMAASVRSLPERTAEITQSKRDKVKMAMEAKEKNEIKEVKASPSLAPKSAQIVQGKRSVEHQMEWEQARKKRLEEQRKKKEETELTKYSFKPKLSSGSVKIMEKEKDKSDVLSRSMDLERRKLSFRESELLRDSQTHFKPKISEMSRKIASNRGLNNNTLIYYGSDGETVNESAMLLYSLPASERLYLHAFEVEEKKRRKQELEFSKLYNPNHRASSISAHQHRGPAKLSTSQLMTAPPPQPHHQQQQQLLQSYYDSDDDGNDGDVEYIGADDDGMDMDELSGHTEQYYRLLHQRKQQQQQQQEKEQEQSLFVEEERKILQSVMMHPDPAEAPAPIAKFNNWSDVMDRVVVSSSSSAPASADSLAIIAPPPSSPPLLQAPVFGFLDNEPQPPIESSLASASRSSFSSSGPEQGDSSAASNEQIVLEDLAVEQHQSQIAEEEYDWARKSKESLELLERSVAESAIAASEDHLLQ